MFSRNNFRNRIYLWLLTCLFLSMSMINHAQEVAFLEWEIIRPGYPESLEIDQNQNVYVWGTRSYIIDQTGNVTVQEIDSIPDTCPYYIIRSDQWNDHRIYIQRLDLQGSRLWDTWFEHPIQAWEPDQSICDWVIGYESDNACNLYITVQYQKCSTTGAAYATAKFSQNTGDELWRQYFGSTAPEDFFLDSQANVYVTGYSGTVKYTSNGDELCAITDPLDNYFVVADKQGNFYALGKERTRSIHPVTWTYYWHTDLRLIKYRSEGVELWRDVIENDFDDDPEYLRIVDGYILVGGHREETWEGDFSFDEQAVIAKYSSQGIKQCESKIDLGGHVQMMDLDASGDLYFITNKVNGHRTGTSFWTTFKVNGSSGDEIWKAEYTSTFNDYDPGEAQCMLLDNTGSVYVAGYLQADAVVLKYTGQADLDGDGIGNLADNCPSIYNPNQSDDDGDGIGNPCDNCPDNANPDQADSDINRQGEAVPDGIGDTCDNCPDEHNPDQADKDGDGVGDICDNCPDHYNPDQADDDNDKLGNVCDICPTQYDPSQTDTDGDGIGDVCDTDDDRDRVPDDQDNCPLVANTGQENTDGYGYGDACNHLYGMDDDDDEWDNDVDNCPNTFNPGQEDADGNGIGDWCEVDLSVSRIEVTQAIQDKDNSVPLVYGKDTYVRIYYDIGSMQSPVGPISGLLRFKYENGLPMLTYVNGMASNKLLSSMNSIQALPASQFDPVNPSHTLNFQIPRNWRWDSMPYIEITTVYAGDDINPYNNHPPLTPLHFYPTRDLNICFVPVYGCYDVYVDGVSPCPPPTESDFWDAAEWLLKIYPIRRIRMWRLGDHWITYNPTSSNLNGGMLYNKLWWLNLFTNDPVDNMKYYGMVCQEIDPISNGVLARGGPSGMGMEDQGWGVRGGWEPDSLMGGETFAHEVGHMILGKTDAGELLGPFIPAHVRDECGAHGPFFNHYPDHGGNLALIDANGYDGFKVYGRDRYYDFMSYSPCDTTGDGSWISTYIYKLLFTLLLPSMGKTSPILNESQETYTAISGMIYEQDDVHSVQIRQLTLPSDESYNVSGEGPYRTELLASNGTVLFTRYFKTAIPDPGNQISLQSTFTEILPFDPNTAFIQIIYNNTAIHIVSVSPYMPEVEVLHPNGGEMLSGQENIVWSATDGDGDLLSYDILYSPDNGTHWRAVALGLNQTHYIWETGNASGTDQGLIKVLASDGTQTAEDVSNDIFSLVKKPPRVHIQEPKNGDTYFLNRRVIFEGNAYDPEDGPLDESLFTWTSSIDGELATGFQISKDILSAGEHTITLTALDSEGLSGMASILLKISAEEDSDGDGISDSEDAEPFVDNSVPPEPTGGGGGGSSVLPEIPDVCVRIHPSVKNLSLNESDTVQVMIEAVEDLGAFEFVLFYDKNTVRISEPNDVFPGSFLGSTGRTVTVLGLEHETDQGKLVFGAYSMGSGAGPDGDGNLAKIVFTGRHPGSSLLQLKSVKVSDSQGQPISANVENGTIQVKGQFWADVDGDGDVDIIDIQRVTACWNSSLDDPEYNALYDVDAGGLGDGDIDIIDIQLIASWWNKSIPAGGQGKLNPAQIQKNPVQLSLNRISPVEYTVTVKEIQDLAGFEITLYTPEDSVLIASAEVDRWMTTAGKRTVQLLGPVKSEDARLVTLGVFSFGEMPGASGSGTMVTLKLMYPLKSMRIQNAVCVNSAGQMIPVAGMDYIDSHEYDNFTFDLDQNFPNPFNPSTRIRYSIAQKSHAILTIYSILGQEIRKLVDSEKEAGVYMAEWDGTDHRGNQVPSGIYIFTLESAQYRESMKMIFIR
ncbi:thrombospondin type 3 repeat-containing protein [bacterium]